MKNKIKIEGNMVVLYYKDKEILVDKEELPKISKHSWCISATGYAVSRINKKTIKLHRYILDLKNPKKVVDHINHNKLDNRKINLRICNNKQNIRNSASSKNNNLGVLGVGVRPSGRYRARIMVDRKEITIGTFDTIEEAKEARKKAEKKYYGEYAPN